MRQLQTQSHTPSHQVSRVFQNTSVRMVYLFTILSVLCHNGSELCIFIRILYVFDNIVSGATLGLIVLYEDSERQMENGLWVFSTVKKRQMTNKGIMLALNVSRLTS